VFGSILSRRFLFFFLCGILLFGCNTSQPSSLNKLTIGVVRLGDQGQSLKAYLELKNYLSEQLNSFVELEPAYNERKALSEIERQRWDLIFAPPGLAVIAIAKAQYRSILTLEGGLKTRSIIVVLEESSLNQLSDLTNKIVALQQPGSATGYYLPIYNLYGLTLAEIRLASTAKQSLTWLTNKEVDAIALSLQEFNLLRTDFPNHQLRVLFTDSHDVPNGSILVASRIDANQEEQILKALVNASPSISASTGYLSNVPLPDYTYLLKVINRVIPLVDEIKEKPVQLYQ
jgi:phosphonate transport system substrate-binding protein